MSPFEIWSLTAVFLFFKIFSTSVTQAFVRVKNSAYAKPEDAEFFGRGVTPLEVELPVVVRAQNALRNDGENIPIFLALSFAYVHLGCWPEATGWYFGVFVGGRYLHTLLMLRPKQPWRNWSYVSGLIIMVLLSGHIVSRVVGE